VERVPATGRLGFFLGNREILAIYPLPPPKGYRGELFSASDVGGARARLDRKTPRSVSPTPPPLPSWWSSSSVAVAGQQSSRGI